MSRKSGETWGTPSGKHGCDEGGTMKCEWVKQNIVLHVYGELPDDAEVSRLRAVGEPGELEVFVHALAKQGAHERNLSRRSEGQPSGKV